MINDLIEIEQRLWANDPEFYESAYMSEAVLIFPETGKISRDTAVEAIREERRKGKQWAEVRFEDVASLNLARDVVLLTYKAIARWNYTTTPDSTLCSTIYVKKHGRWRVAFHQQTSA